MSGVKDIFKNGWHPDKGTNLKDQVTGVFRRGESDKHTSHSPTPISQLRDPASFAPPPKHVAARSIAPPPPLAPRSSKQPPAIPSRPSPTGHSPESSEPTVPQPYKVDTTGLSTAHLPTPPPRRNAGTPTSPQDAAFASPPPQYAVVAPGGPPRLPPRLPPRAAPTTDSPTTAGSDTGLINRGAADRLGAAGISVPGFGIGSSKTAAASAGSSSPSSSFSSQMSGLGSRFAKLGTSFNTAAAAPDTKTPPPPPGGGTTFAQKQAALKTAANFHKDPSSVSLSDARAAASTANNFRQRHGDQVAAGLKTANGLNQKYGIADRVAAAHERASSPADGTSSGVRSPASPVSLAAGLLAKKKPPPPPPPKRKPGLEGYGGGSPTAGDTGDDMPPPIPMATRPTF